MGIELSFARPADLLAFNINKKNLKNLRELRFNSIHAPWKEIVYGDNTLSRKVLKTISELFKEIKAKNVVFHKDQVEEFAPIKVADFIVSIENNDWRKPEHSIEDIERLFNKNKGFKFTFDFAHALSVSSTDILRYVQCFRSRLIEIHLSIIDKASEKHDFLHKYDDTEIRKLLQSLKDFSAPIVLEGVVPSLTEIKLLEQEIEYLINL